MIGSLSGFAAQKVPPLILKSEPSIFLPKEFYFKKVVDARPDKRSFALLAGTSGQELVELSGGTFNAVEHFVEESIPKNFKLRPVVIKLKNFKITENAVAPNIVKGRLDLRIAFELEGKEKNQWLVDYQGGVQYTRPINQFNIIEPGVRKSLSDALVFFNNWIIKEANSNEKLAKGVKLSFQDFSKEDKDTIYYNSAKPLTWDVFQAKPPTSSIYAASIFPGFGYEGKSSVVNGFIEVQVTMKVYALPDGSWVKDEARNSYNLNHEQRHFDLAKIIAERFKKKIKSQPLTLEDFDSVLRYEYIESYREMNEIQKRYDNETSHGINQGMQDSWNRKIDEELSTY